MPPVVITGTLQIRVVWTLGGADYGQNVLHANIGGTPSVDQSMASTIAGFAGAAHTGSGLAALQPSSVVLDRVDIRDLRTANQPLLSASVASAGTATGQLLPRGTAQVVTLRTALAGRSFRGRVYVPGFAEEAADVDGRATQAARDAAVAFVEGFGDSMAANGWPLGVASVKLAAINNIVGMVSRDSVWDRQWRRAHRG